MHYSIEPRDRIYVEGYGFLSFAKNMGTHLSNKYCQKLLDSAKKPFDPHGAWARVFPKATYT